jgi:hypothetical protein
MSELIVCETVIILTMLPFFEVVMVILQKLKSACVLSSFFFSISYVSPTSFGNKFHRAISSNEELAR